MFPLVDHSHEASGEGVWEGYVHIITDPGHFLAELTFTLFDILILTPLLFLLWKLFRRWVVRMIDKEHHKIDAEHGVKEHGGSACPNCAKYNPEPR